MLDVLGEAALRTLLLAAVVGCGLRVLRIRQPQLLLAAWTVVLVTSICMPMLARLAPLRVPVDQVLPTMLIDDAGDALVSTAAQILPTEVPAEQQPQRSLRWWLLAVYVVVAATTAFRVLLGLALSLRLLANSVPVHAEWVAGMRVRTSRAVATPVTVACTILLPIDAGSWSADTRRAVLAHEGAHVARWDFAMLVLAQLNRALFWFNPLSWWLYRRLVILTELASDDQAMVVTRDPLGYAEVLLEMGRRSAPVLRGPAMARLSTLASRIDRILDEPIFRRADPSLQVVLAAAVTGLSLASASLVPDPISHSDIAPLPLHLTRPDVAALGPPLPSVTKASPNEPRSEAERAPALKKSSSVASPSLDTKSAPEPPYRVPNVQQGLVPPRPASAQRPPSGMRPAQRPSSKRATRSIAAVSARPSIQAGSDRAARNDGANLQPLEATEAISPKVARSDLEVRHSSQADNGRHSPPPYQVIQNSTSAPRHLDFEEIMSSTCTGTILVGLRARQSTQPDIVAGQTVEAKAQFFRRENGAPWVRFFAFGRPPLDLPVRFTQGRMTWTGEYGISYAVQPSGGDHLVGLAAQVAADSAQLEFTCKTSTVRTL